MHPPFLGQGSGSSWSSEPTASCRPSSELQRGLIHSHDTPSCAPGRSFAPNDVFEPYFRGRGRTNWMPKRKEARRRRWTRVSDRCRPSAACTTHSTYSRRLVADVIWNDPLSGVRTSIVVDTSDFDIGLAAEPSSCVVHSLIRRQLALSTRVETATPHATH
jgi:hypothetical protein